MDQWAPCLVRSGLLGCPCQLLLSSSLLLMPAAELVWCHRKLQECSRTEQSPQVARWEMVLVAAVKSPRDDLLSVQREFFCHEESISSNKCSLHLIISWSPASATQHVKAWHSRDFLQLFPVPNITEVRVNYLCSLQTHRYRNNLKEAVVFILSGKQPYQRSRRWTVREIVLPKQIDQ